MRAAKWHINTGHSGSDLGSNSTAKLASEKKEASTPSSAEWKSWISSASASVHAYHTNHNLGEKRVPPTNAPSKATP